MKQCDMLKYKIELFWQGLRLRKVGTDLLAVFGALWLAIEVFTFFNKQEFANELKSGWWLFLISSVGFVIYQNWPKNKFTFKVNNKDVSITIQIGDIFKVDGALIIPVNNRLDVDSKGIVNNSKSILRYFIGNVYKKNNSHLTSDIKFQLVASSSWYSNFIINNDPFEYKIGTVVPIFSEEKQYYLLCNSTLNEQNRSNCSEVDLQNSLVELWAYLSHCGGKDNLVIPIIGTGRGRIPMTREEVFKEIVLSFLPSLSNGSYCEQLTICIHPDAIRMYNMNIDDLKDFVRSQCKYANFSRTNEKPIGQSIE